MASRHFETHIVFSRTNRSMIERLVGKIAAEGGYHYGAIFIGMTDTDALKIDIYQIFNDL